MALLHQAVFHCCHLLGDRQLKPTTLRCRQGDPEILAVQLKLETSGNCCSSIDGARWRKAQEPAAPSCKAATKSLIGKPNR